MKIVILGKGDMLANLIEGTLDAKCTIAGVFRYERTTFSKIKLFFYDFFKPSNDLTLIKKLKIHELTCTSANSEEFKKEILKLNADIILVGSWGEKLSKETINLPKIATVNVHPSYLPQYRGPNPYLQTIWHQESNSGITFHLMDENFDTGAIVAQQKIKIYPGDTGKELKERTLFQARLMVSEVLKKLEYGIVIPVAQDETKATYFKNIKPVDMMLDFQKETAEEICAHIRAFHPWCPCYVTYKNDFFIPNPYNLKIIDSTKPNIGAIIDKNVKNKSITVQCQNNKAIVMDNVKIYGFLKSPYTKYFISKIKCV